MASLRPNSRGTAAATKTNGNAKATSTALLDLGDDLSRDSGKENDSSLMRDLDVSTDRYGERSGGGGRKKAEKGAAQLTLREQEKVIDDFKKENFDLKLKIHFLEERLSRLAPDHIEQALQENVQLKVSFETMRNDVKKYKKLLSEGNKAIETLSKERDEATGKISTGNSQKVLDLEREVARLKAGRTSDGGSGDDQSEISRLRDELEQERDVREDLLGELDDKDRELREANDRFEDAQEELARLREGGGDDASMTSQSFADGGRRGRDKESRREADRLARKAEELEQANASLRSQVSAQVTMLTARNAEKDALKDEVENLKQDILHLENELDQHDRARARDERSINSNEDKPREQLQEELDEYRDRAAAHALELEEKEKEIEELLEDLDAHKAQHEAEIRQLEDDWRGAVEDAQLGERAAKEALEDKEAELEELAEKAEALLQQLAEKDAEMQADSEEVEALTDDLKKLGAQILSLEEEVDQKDARIQELDAELDAMEKDLEDKQNLHNQIVDALKEKLNSHKAQLSDITIQHESALTEGKFLREKVEELALRTAEHEEQSRGDIETRHHLEDEAEELMRALKKEEDERDLDQQEFARQRREDAVKWQRELDAKEKALRDALSDLSQQKGLIAVRDADIKRMQYAMENESRRLDESHSNDRTSLKLELDRVRRDLARYEDDLKREKALADERGQALRDADMALAAAKSDGKDLAAQLASQTQTRLLLADKYDQASKSLRNTQTELTNARERLRKVEDQLNSGHRTHSKTENQFRDQLTERNTLLLTIYQYMDKMVGSSERSPRRPGQADPKPFTNFPIFHDSLIHRVKAVNQIQLSFERRTKEIESKFTDQIANLKRQQDTRLRQLDRFEAAVKTATDTQRQWRQRVNTKQIELDAAKATSAELQTQIASLRQRASVAGVDPGLSAKMTVLTTRATTAERRLAATQAQLTSAEEKLGEARTKVAVAEGKWEARLRELEARLHAAEERVKRERQGAKERVAELTKQINHLEGEVGGARRRDHLLEGVVREAQTAPSVFQ